MKKKCYIWPQVRAISLVSLGLLTLALLCPWYSDEAAAKTVVVVDDAATTGKVTVYPMISLALDTGVEIEATPKSNGSFFQDSGRLVVSTNNSSGYSILMHSLDDDTLESTSGAVINPIAEDGRFTANTWGAYVGVGVVTESNFKKISTATTTMRQTDSTTGVDEYQVAFGAMVDTKLPAGVYTRQVVVSAVTNPVTLSGLNDLEYMQDMTPEICAASAIGSSAVLTDLRDSNTYWVEKLKDGNCWMTQNLALDLSTSKTLTPADTDVKSDWTPNKDTASGQVGASHGSFNHWSWDYGQWVLATPETSYTCSSTSIGVNCPTYNWVDVSDTTQFAPTYAAELNSWNGATPVDNTLVAVSCKTWSGTGISRRCTSGTYDPHYLAGNYYHWVTATAGTGKTVSTSANTQMTSTICPKGWTLPTAQTDAFGTAGNLNSGTPGSFAYLLKQYGLATSSTAGNVQGSEIEGVVYNIAGRPLSFVRSGYYYFYGKGYMENIGANGVYWTKSGGPGGDNQQFGSSLKFGGSTFTMGPQTTNFEYGASIRCVAVSATD